MAQFHRGMGGNARYFPRAIQPLFTIVILSRAAWGPADKVSGVSGEKDLLLPL